MACIVRKTAIMKFKLYSSIVAVTRQTVLVCLIVGIAGVGHTLDWDGLQHDADDADDGRVADADVDEVADEHHLQRQQPDEVRVDEGVVEPVHVVGQQVHHLPRRGLRQRA